MSRDLRDKVVAITGGAEGLGFSIADVYLQRGAKVVVLLDINENLGTAATDTLNKKYGPNKAAYFKCDVTSDLETVFNRVIDTYKNVDVLVNNAGILNEFDVKKTMAVNVTAVLEWSLKFWEHMRKDKGGKGGTIINMSSIYGYRIDPYIPVYKASKFAVMGFTKTLGHSYNYKRSGVRVFAICPGFTETNLVNDIEVSKDVKVQEDMNNFMNVSLWQKSEAVGNAAVITFSVADSGTAWLIEGDKPVTQID